MSDDVTSGEQSSSVLSSSVFSDVAMYTGGIWLEHQDVRVVGGVVESISPHASSTTAAAESISTGGYLIPGFVNTHTHLQQSLMRGIAELSLIHI